jgi:hypothetical protein
MALKNFLMEDKIAKIKDINGDLENGFITI